ncbi:peptidoglycan-binding protein [Streptomyces sp. NPDC007929]|uniref:peptidoglycan-binding domain-containing protein n=1 Tax=unclassified Streptomyces TaxID=2593676 RepID=UPI0036E15460
MTIRTPRRRLTVVAVLGTALGAVLAMSTTPASAASSDGYISGSGGFRNDWSDEFVSSGARSNAVCMWQKILWAEGLLSNPEVDGVFGGKTVQRTRTLQSRWHVSPTGKADNTTFTAAAAPARLKYVSGSTGSGKRLVLKYDGFDHDFNLVRNERGRYEFHLDGAWKPGTYKKRTCQ